MSVLDHIADRTSELAKKKNGTTQLAANAFDDRYNLAAIRRFLSHPQIDMLIPNAENAIVDIRKLREYCLNPEHKDGKHKARLFSASLGMTADDAEELRQILLEVVMIHEIKLGRQDEFGQRYTLDFEISWQNRKAMLRSGWIIEPNSEIPKLTTCYPL